MEGDDVPLIRFDPASAVTLTEEEEREMLGRLGPLAVTMVGGEHEEGEVLFQSLLEQGPLVAVWLRHYS